MLRPLAHDGPVRCVTKNIDQALHEIDVGTAQRAQGKVDKRRTLRPFCQGSGKLEGVVCRTHRRVDPVPGVVERPAIDIVRLLWKHVEIGVRGSRHEIEVRKRLGAARHDEVVEVAPDLVVRPLVLGTECLPFAPVVGSQPGKGRRNIRTSDFKGVAADDPHERCVSSRERRKDHHPIRSRA